MQIIPGYIITEKIYENFKTVVYKAYSHEAQAAAIVKIPRATHPTWEEIICLKNEYEISKNLDIPGIVKPYKLANYPHGLALILEYFDGESLEQFALGKPLETIAFLKIAIALADTLNRIHSNLVIHKDIKPHNILINPQTLETKITDFSIASRLTRENLYLSNCNSLEGTLAYISPEQTGRMNRNIDYRTDLYSLGVTFYEILTGQLPFDSTDPLELIHCHIAKQPLPPNKRISNIPEAVSDTIVKLLAKNAEDRYQSALGLKADLELCLDRLSATGQIINFSPGQWDKASQFLIPQKLYGREKEVASLMEAFERVSNPRLSPERSRNESGIEMMLVSGYSGIGKSSLVNEVHKPIVRQRGYFIAGKFDQFKRNIPYLSVVSAFQDLIRQLLTESKENIAGWKNKLLDALAANGQIIIDVIPEVELIVGPQPPVPQLGPAESQNRFNRVFQQFIQVFTKPEHPLVLFLDDLQWADSASLKLIQVLMTNSDSKYLLLMGAYRDNEVSATHPLMLTLEEILKAGAIVNNIILRALDMENVSQLVADTLGERTHRSQPLADLVYNKTQGNPFFLTQLLTSLYQEKLLNFDFSSGMWQWDIAQIQAIGITDYNVVELIAKNIQKLSEETQTVLKLAACVGNQFNLSVLAIVNEKSQSATAADLWSALQAGLILPLSNAYKIPLLLEEDSRAALTFDRVNVSYKFLHDRVQQAAYSLIPEERKKETHLKIGQLLLKNTNPEERKENIFALVNQLNFGTDLIACEEEKYELAELNFIAGQKAKAATAYEPALKYLNVGLELLGADSWQSHYELTLNLYLEAAEVEYLNINFERSAILADTILQHATKLLDRVKVYEIQIQFYMAQNQMLTAMNTGLQALEMLGVSLSSPPSSDRWVVDLPELEDLENLPAMTDPYHLATLRLLISVVAPATMAKPEILPLLVLTQVNFCIEHGCSAQAAVSYAFYGMILCAIIGKVDAGYKSGQLALRLLQRFDARELQSKVYNLFNLFIRPWKEHTKETITPFLQGFQSGLETGDLEFACYCANNYCSNMFWLGEPVELVEKQQHQYLTLQLSFKQEYSIYYAKIWRQLSLNISGAESGYLLIGSSLDESESLPVFLELNNPILLFSIYFAKSFLFYLFGNYTEAVANAELAVKYAAPVMGWIVSFAAYNFYYSLALLAVYRQGDCGKEDRQQELLKQVEENQEKMRKWAEYAPCNFQHKYELVEAEKARVLGQILAAMEYYDRAINGAKEQGYIQEEALANELAAEFYFSLDRKKVSQTYLMEAYYGYIRWGAMAKVKNLESRYSQILSQIIKTETQIFNITKTTTLTNSIASDKLDFATVIKASQAVTDEIVLDRLLDKLLNIAMENAGAQKSCLILDKNGQLLIEATGSVERDGVVMPSSIPVSCSQHLPICLINFVARTCENVVLNDAAKEGKFTADPYIIKNQPKSILCVPIINQSKSIGILYLENNLTAGAFTPGRLEVIKILSSQAAISLKNAMLYNNLEVATENLKQANEQLEDYSKTLERRVDERTLELREKNQQLQQTLQELQQTQTQLIQNEKMSSLGQLVAGIAHEINNPVNFIYGNLNHARQYLEDLLHLIRVYDKYSNNSPEIEAEIEASDFEFVRTDFPKIIDSMQVGADRIRQIVLSLRNFSRLDEADMKSVDIHSGIDSSLLILQHRLKEKVGNPPIEVIKDYGQLPKVECYPGQLNQVFMNILTNAIDALYDREYTDKNSVHAKQSPYIRICTDVLDNGWVLIKIADNGPGMREEIRQKLFDPFFTTKPVGSGTGLGLSITYQIVVEKHGGKLKCSSVPGEGAEFVIEIPVKQQRKGLGVRI
ncbi:trifunctional serine/threonine-protein kinase/ATP-binding protein/sensor histidine kinase [Aerosakkonema funiforme]|uniref:trifunctional serine/threonine-protein kinase/ATP-binding protein/sensor histidine kinase n=1 Tax=Aerosakkonema funiforme TaxID=1246630 RepID=UPI0035B6B131